jgi:hypothetical protein
MVAAESQMAVFTVQLLWWCGFVSANDNIRSRRMQRMMFMSQS